MKKTIILISLVVSISQSKLIDVTNKYSSNLLSKINFYRENGYSCSEKMFQKTNPLKRLKINEYLTKSAKIHGIDLAVSNIFSHEGSGLATDVASLKGHPSKFYERIEWAGYEYSKVGENLALNQSSVNQVFNDWLKSEPHCKNIFDPLFREIGIFILYDTQKSKYIWVNEFGLRKLP